MGKENAWSLSKDTIRFINKKGGNLFSWDGGGAAKSTCPLGVEGANKKLDVCAAETVLKMVLCEGLAFDSCDSSSS